MEPNRRHSLLLALFAIACAPGGAEPNKPGTKIGPPLDVTVDHWMTDPVARALSSPSGGAFVEQNDRAYWLENIGAAPRELATNTGALAGAAVIDGHTLIAGANGVFIFDATTGALERSPISDALQNRAPSNLLAAGGDLWISTPTSLHRWHENELTEYTLQNLALINPKLAYGAPIAGRPALWGLSGGFLFSLSETSQAQIHREAEIFDALAIDGEGRLWTVTEQKLTTRDPEGIWHTIHELEGVQNVVAHASTGGAWIITNTGLWREHQGTLHPIENPPAGEIFVADSAGRLLIGGTTGLFRIRAGRTPEIFGLTEGSVLLEPREITIRIAQPEVAASTTLAIDGMPITFDAGASTKTLQLDPGTLTEGPHTLKITVTYADGAADAILELDFASFRGQPPTWSTDITELFDQHCAQCHALGGVGRRLDSRQNWIENIGRILAAVREARMPLPPNPPLSAEEIARIAGWQAAGFLE